MKKNIIFILICLLLSSCFKENIISQDDLPITRNSSADVIRFENPYSLANMQAAFNDLNPGSNTILQPTDLYVRFQPIDSTDLRILLDLDIELFDYPIGYMLSVGGEMTVPPKDTNSFLYTTVNANFQFPDVYYEIIEECYIPFESAGSAGSADFAKGMSQEDLEQQAYYRRGLSKSPTGTVTKGINRETPQGYIYVDTSSSQYVGVKGIKVIGRNFIKIGKGNTNKYGRYELNHSFMTNVEYSISFRNSKDFSIWDGIWVFNASEYIGIGPNTGIDYYITENKKSWEWAVINNATWDYYEMCEIYGIDLPPSKLRIMRFKGGSNVGCAPMMRRISLPQNYSFNDGWMSYLTSFTVMSIIAPLLLPLQMHLPDIIILGNNRDYESLYSVTGHELAHASHFSQVGSEFWNQYILFFILHGTNDDKPYGERTDSFSSICEVGEMWAYFLEEIFVAEHFNRVENLSLPNEWFDESIEIIWDLHQELLDRGEIFNAFMSGVTNVDSLKSKMKLQNPSEDIYIDIIFAQNNHFTRNNIWSIVNESSDDLLINVVRPFQQIGHYPVDFGRPQRAFGSISIGEADQISINAVDFKIGDTIQIAMLPNRMDNFLDIVNEPKIAPTKVVLSNEAEEPLQIWTPTSYVYNKSKWLKNIDFRNNRTKVTWVYIINDNNLNNL